MNVRIGLVWALLCASSCGERAHEEASSGAECEPDSELDYESFGQEFMLRYCTSCHSSELPSSARNGAPSDHDFDTLEAIRDTELEHLDHVAAAGPNATHTEMPPPGYPAPTQQERENFGRWVACGTP